VTSLSFLQAGAVMLASTLTRSTFYLKNKKQVEDLFLVDTTTAQKFQKKSGGSALFQDSFLGRLYLRQPKNVCLLFALP
jgi:hypothetical protein